MPVTNSHFIRKEELYFIPPYEIENILPAAGIRIGKTACKIIISCIHGWFCNIYFYNISHLQ